MARFTLDIGGIVDLDTLVGATGALADTSWGTGDELFEYIVGIALLLYEYYPR